ncbi:Ubiquitin-protein ligase E3A [Nymphon striatum]|nr:Ubiquitin-protein ligase E3A [Nymphon striatum]
MLAVHGITPCSRKDYFGGISLLYEFEKKNNCILKRAAAKKLIEKYYYQLTDGCGNSECDNANCASSGKLSKMSPDNAAAQALQKSFSMLVRTIGEVFSNAESLNKSFLLPPKKKVSSSSNLLKEEIREIEGDQDKDHDSMDICDCDSEKPDIYLKSDEESLDLASLRRCYQQLFEIKDHPFQNSLINALMMLFETAFIDLKIKSETIAGNSNYLNMFVIISELPCLHNDEYQKHVVPAFCRAGAQLSVPNQAKLAKIWAKNCTPDHIKTLIDVLHQLITCKIYAAPMQGDYCINDDVTITSATKVLKILYFASIVSGKLIELPGEDLEDPEENIPVDCFFHGSKDQDNTKKSEYKDPLESELGIGAVDCREPLVPFDEFYHEPLSDQLEVNKDFANYKEDLEAAEGSSSTSVKFSFMNYSFITTPATKSLSLYLDNRTRMLSERRNSMYHSIMRGSVSSPFLKLKVRRDYIIADALVELEMIVRENPTDLKKQLVVEFDGEQGIDEGGVSKEFFHLVVEEIFNPDFGMFIFNPDVELYWFNPTSFETDGQFVLIGIVVGLAIYNNVILDIHLPMVAYRKLFGKNGTLHDLQELYPDLCKGLTELLLYEGDDIEEVFMQTFRVGYHDIFGSYVTQDLKENGDDVHVNQSNKKEFVDLYADFLLNKSVVKQFRAFKRGFQIVTEESPIKMLFRPEEVELLVCGSKLLNFNELEETTEYDGGYYADSPIIKQFWEIVHEFSEDQKRKLLQFCSGSDRVPVGGLSKLKLVICKNGDDSDRMPYLHRGARGCEMQMLTKFIICGHITRNFFKGIYLKGVEIFLSNYVLPTAHTCFNVLLLPEYESKEKLHSVLLKAIMYSKGFGMLRTILLRYLEPYLDQKIAVEHCIIPLKDKQTLVKFFRKASHDLSCKCCLCRERHIKTTQQAERKHSRTHAHFQNKAFVILLICIFNDTTIKGLMGWAGKMMKVIEMSVTISTKALFKNYSLVALFVLNLFNLNHQTRQELRTRPNFMYTIMTRDLKGSSLLKIITHN